MPSGLTVLAAIRPGEEEPLREVLRAIGNDVNGKDRTAGDTRPHVDFPSSRTTHFARFAVLDDPDRGAGRRRLLYSSNYDGTLDGHLADLVAVTTDMAAIWGRCEGYDGVASFPAFVRARARPADAFYIAFRDERLASLRGTASPAPRAGPLARAWRALPAALDVGRAMVRCGPRHVVGGTARIIATLDRFPAIRLVNRLTGNRLPPRRSPWSSVSLDNCPQPGDRLPPGFREDVVAQNQLTLVTEVDPRRVRRLRAVLAAIDSYARRLSPPGSLVGISTIHFVRWLLVDDDRRLVMLSDYDGSWESYIDEFAEMILSGLDAIWETSAGYPPDGARDLPAFKRFLRSHQVASEVFFSAYPDTTVLNLAHRLGHADR